MTIEIQCIFKTESSRKNVPDARIIAVPLDSQATSLPAKLLHPASISFVSKNLRYDFSSAVSNNESKFTFYLNTKDRAMSGMAMIWHKYISFACKWSKVWHMLSEDNQSSNF